MIQTPHLNPNGTTPFLARPRRVKCSVFGMLRREGSRATTRRWPRAGPLSPATT